MCVCVCVCVCVSFSPILWMINADMYTMRYYSETALQGAGCLLQKCKAFSLILSTVIMEFFLPICQSGAVLYANPVIINEFDFEKCSLFLNQLKIL